MFQESKPLSTPCTIDNDNQELHDGEFFVSEDVEIQRVAELSDNTKLVRKIDLHVLPLSVLTFVLCNLDRSNIGNAKIMNKEQGNDLLDDTGTSNYEYTIALIVFFVTYCLFDIPSVILFKKFKPSRWIAFSMFAWGAVTVGLGCVHTPTQLAILRCLLGIFEAGLFPSIVYHITFWYRRDERSLRVALILASATLASAFGGAIAYGVSQMQGITPISAWRWLFILEGILSVLLALPVLLLFPNYPKTVSWLSTEERALSAMRLADSASKASDGNLTWVTAKTTLCDYRLWIHYIAYFGICVPFASLSLFAPTIVTGLGYTSLRAQLMTVPPYAVAYVFTLAAAYVADRFNRRGLVAAGFAMVGAIGFVASASLPAHAYTSRYACLIVACVGAFACIPPLLGWLSSNTRSTATAGLAIALNNSFGAPGQIVGVCIYESSQATEGYPTGHWTNAALLFVVVVCCLCLHVLYTHRNKHLSPGELPWAL